MINRTFGTTEDKRKANLGCSHTGGTVCLHRNKGEGPNRKSNSSPGNDVTPEFPWSRGEFLIRKKNSVNAIQTSPMTALPLSLPPCLIRLSPERNFNNRWVHKVLKHPHWCSSDHPDKQQQMSTFTEITPWLYKRNPAVILLVHAFINTSNFPRIFQDLLNHSSISRLTWKELVKMFFISPWTIIRTFIYPHGKFCR